MSATPRPQRTRRSRWLLGAFIGVFVGLGQLIGGPYLVLIVLVLLAIWAYGTLGKAGLGGYLLGAGLAPLVRLVPELLFGCGGGPSLSSSDTGLTTCLGPPSSFWLWWTALNVVIALAGAALTVIAAREQSVATQSPG